jgi:hypothetical protein
MKENPEWLTDREVLDIMAEAHDTGASYTDLINKRLNEFARCVEINCNGTHAEINCRKGLWSVSGSSFHQIIGEALHYWQQYRADGEYEEITKGTNE